MQTDSICAQIFFYLCSFMQIQSTLTPFELAFLFFPSLRSRRLEVVGARNNERARGRHAVARPLFLGPATPAKFHDNGVMMSPISGRNIISLVFTCFCFFIIIFQNLPRRLKVFNWFTFFMDRYSIPSLISHANFNSCFEVRLVIGLIDGSL